MGKLLHEKLTYKIIGAAFEVHKALGYGFLESVYENALSHELELRKLEFERQVHLPVTYKDIEVGHFIADIVVNNKVILELKASTKSISDHHIAQTINYLAATGIDVGIILNFGRPSLEKKRLVRNNKRRISP
ncbi:MAG: GxxExxY protein [Ardenticatenaceae bacterium]|nr:GxxExxY protein [Ardenticatenaceae bacterium]